MLEAERRQPSNVLGPDVEAFGAEAIERRIHVDRVPQDDEIDDKPKCPELIFLAFPLALPQFTAFAVEDNPRQLVATFAPVKLDQDAAAVTLVVDEAQHIERLRPRGQRVSIV
jgi:hypothetical protein